MNTGNEQSSTDSLEGVIYQAYEETPHADPVRLAAIERGLISMKEKKPQRIAPRTPWWIMGLALTAGTAVAWWAVQQQNIVMEQTQEEITHAPLPLEHSTGSVQVNIDSSPEEEKNARLAEAKNASNEDRKNKQTDTADIDKKQRSSIIYSREVF